MGIIDISNTISVEELKLASKYNSTVDLLQQNIINNQLFETHYEDLRFQTRKLDDLHKLLASFDIKQKSQIINLEKQNEILIEKNDEKLLKQQRRIYLGIALGFLLFISFSQKQFIGSLFSMIDKRILFSILIFVIIYSYLNRSFIIESFNSYTCDSKKQIDIIRAMDSTQFKDLAQDLLVSETSLDKLKNPPALFLSYSKNPKAFNIATSGDFNLSC
jgi:hypothetical protein